MSKKITALYERSAAPNPEHIRRQKNNLETFAQLVLADGSCWYIE